MKTLFQRLRLDWVESIIVALLALLVGLLLFQRPLARALNQDVASSSEAEPTGDLPPDDADPAVELEQNWGIRAEGLRLALGGNMLDFRYTILNPVRAGFLRSQTEDAFLLHEASGTRIPLPNANPSGTLRRRSNQLAAGRTYSLNFPNVNRRFASGETATIVLGEFEARHLVVE